MLYSVAIIIFAVWLLGFSLAVAITIIGFSEFTHKSGREITIPERILVVSFACVFWFVFFLPPVIEHIKGRD